MNDWFRCTEKLITNRLPLIGSPLTLLIWVSSSNLGQFETMGHKIARQVEPWSHGGRNNLETSSRIKGLRFQTGRNPKDVKNDCRCSSRSAISFCWSGENLRTAANTLDSVMDSRPIMYWKRMFFRYSYSLASSREWLWWQTWNEEARLKIITSGSIINTEQRNFRLGLK